MKLDALAALDTIPREQLPAAIARLAARILEPPPASANGRLLTPDDVAKRLRTHRKWVYRHADELGGVLLSDRALRFTEAGVTAYLTRVRGSRS